MFQSLPVDGVITEGSAFLDESAITGESMPVEKAPGDKAVSATILTSGYLEDEDAFFGGLLYFAEEHRLLGVIAVADVVKSDSAAAIAALQEAGGKLSRNMIDDSYDAYSDVLTLCIELIRQFYDLPRQFRLLGEDGMRFVSYSARSLPWS